MNKTTPKAQLHAQVLNELANENTGDLSKADLKKLVDDLWDWASSLKTDEHAVRITNFQKSKESAGRTVLELAGPDKPFLVDSVLGACISEGLAVQALFHPIIDVANDEKLSIIQVHVAALGKAEAKRLKTRLERTLKDVTAAVADYSAMRDRMAAEIIRLSGVQSVSKADRAEAVAFLEWLAKQHFVFLGCREYTFATGKDGRVLPEEPQMVKKSNLGILRDSSANVLSRDAEPLVLSEKISDVLSEPFPLIVAKSTLVSRVHRRVRCDYIGVKRYDVNGQVNGEVRFLGLFTAEAYDETARSIPFIRNRAKKVIEASGVSEGGHSEKALANIIETWPRDELFQTPSRDLAPIMIGVLNLIGRPRTRVFVRNDQFQRFVSVIVYVPRDAYDSELRLRISRYLEEAYDGALFSFQPRFDSGPLCRVHFQITVRKGHPTPDAATLQKDIEAMALTWDQTFREALQNSDRPNDLKEGADTFSGAFNAAYREAFAPAEAIVDIGAMATLSDERPLVARAFTSETDTDTQLRFKIYNRQGALALSDCVPVFENMGLFVKFETGYPIRRAEDIEDGGPDIYWLHDLSMHRADGEPLDVADVAERFEEAFVAVWQSQAENDAFNQLVLVAGATWREAALMRALSAYRRQTGMDQPKGVQAETFAAHPNITRLLIDLFAARFDPDGDQTLKAREKDAAKIYQDIETAMEDVDSLLEDQVLRRTADLIQSLTRTNFYQQDEAGAPKAFITFKVASRELVDLPEPKPFREIFTSSPQVDGVHLRFGPVARGGLRWSDRSSDYRTEVLGLVKAQQVKNAVIVPVGSKGGFYPKQLPSRANREAWFEAGRDAYKQFITALLGVTDNLVGANVSHPERTVIWDGEDPYFVVAADKGTATFSDTANAISQAHGFWLDDAFASGGSVGYDHKKMGITARGAWEAVKRHFREIGKDIQTEDFDVIGCGDMSGDVFGNGMLLSKKIRLTAAFNHMHIFIDPDPKDTEKCWAERKRLFEKDRSSWTDYNEKFISKGGGIFDRSAKSIELTPEIQALTKLSKDAVTPTELIHALLQSETELLWFGGIGTYVKSFKESHGDVGDRANDALRVDGKQLKARVIGEGANLGLTQAGRIEFALNGGRLNTDAIDNSAGVDSSDHEVNIKILAAEAIRLKSLKASDRNGLLADMTDEVAELVLQHNYNQSGALSIAEASAQGDHEALARVMNYLEDRGVLNRAVEGLPAPFTMEARGQNKEPLTRPELAVLLAWYKIVLFDDLVGSDLPDDEHFETVLENYFPSPIDQQKKAINNHKLKREIISTVLSNRALDLAGPAAMLQAQEVSGAGTVAITRGIEIARELLNHADFLNQVNALDNTVDAGVQTQLLSMMAQAMNDAAALFARKVSAENIASVVKTFRADIDAFKKDVAALQSKSEASVIERQTRNLVKAGVPDALARWASALDSFVEGLYVVDAAKRAKVKSGSVAAAYFHLGDTLRLARLRMSARQKLSGLSYWDRIATRGLIADLVRQQAQLAADVGGKDAATEWIASHTAPRRQFSEVLSKLAQGRDWSFARFALSAEAARSMLTSEGK